MRHWCCCIRVITPQQPGIQPPLLPRVWRTLAREVYVLALQIHPRIRLELRTTDHRPGWVGFPPWGRISVLLDHTDPILRIVVSSCPPLFRGDKRHKNVFGRKVAMSKNKLSFKAPSRWLKFLIIDGSSSSTCTHINLSRWVGNVFWIIFINKTFIFFSNLRYFIILHGYVSIIVRYHLLV
jgi:hypothetical protein